MVLLELQSYSLGAATFLTPLTAMDGQLPDSVERGLMFERCKWVTGDTFSVVKLVCVAIPSINVDLHQQEVTLKNTSGGKDVTTSAPSFSYPVSTQHKALVNGD